MENYRVLKFQNQTGEFKALKLTKLVRKSYPKIVLLQIARLQNFKALRVSYLENFGTLNISYLQNSFTKFLLFLWNTLEKVRTLNLSEWKKLKALKLIISKRKSYVKIFGHKAIRICSVQFKNSRGSQK